jgi:lipoate synthase
MEEHVDGTYRWGMSTKDKIILRSKNMYKQKPDWLRIRVQGDSKYAEVEEILKRLSLNTVCEEANCPNRM